MDALLARRLNSRDTAYEPELFRKLSQIARDYIDAGNQSFQYHVADFDIANDIVQTWAPFPGDWKGGIESFDKMDMNDAGRFIHPMTATETTTVSTFISQILFGGPTARKVEPRNEDLPPAVKQRIVELEKLVALAPPGNPVADDVQKELDRLRDLKPAELVNELLQWNDDQQETYLQGFLWCWDAWTFNRGIMYDHWQDQFKVELEAVQEELPFRPKKDEQGNDLPDDGAREKATRYKKKRTKVGGFNKIDLVSPYDFICDPTMPIIRFQDGRFAGHRVLIPWMELKRRSELPVDDYYYVLPAVVDKLKNQPTSSNLVITTGQGPTTNRSRSYWERIRRGMPNGTIGATDKINKEDGGVIECFCLQIRQRPNAIGLYNDTEEEKIELLIAAELDLLSTNVMPNVHDEYPYCIGEARPHAHTQFSQSWVLTIKSIQDAVDFLKNQKMENVARTGGNMFLYDPLYTNIRDFFDNSKVGLCIPITSEGRESGKELSQMLTQIPVVDTTADNYRDMEMWIQQADIATGAHAYIQGQTEDPSQTATQFSGVQQMGVGRISTIARCLAAPLCRQTRRFVMNFKQFMPDEQMVRITSDKVDIDPDKPHPKFLVVKKTDIEMEYDVIPSDGSLPGMDARKLAGLTRVLEAADDPASQACFDPTIPGSFDIKLLIFEAAKAAGLRVRNFLITKEQAERNKKAKMESMQPPAPPQGQPGAPGPIAPLVALPPPVPQPGVAT